MVPHLDAKKSMENLDMDSNCNCDVLDREYTSVIGFKEALPRKSTIVKPFSFDERDKLLLQKKQDTIEKAKEEEKNAAIFKAHPIPSYLHLHDGPSSSSSSTCSDYSHTSDDSNRHSKVGRCGEGGYKKKVFKPTVVQPFHFATAERVRLRLEYDMNQKRLHEEATQRYMAEKRREENEKIKKLRQSLVHKPVPVPPFITRYKSMTNQHQTSQGDHSLNNTSEQPHHDNHQNNDNLNKSA